jgi:hypothetical protein
MTFNIFAGPSSDEPCAVVFVTDAAGEPVGIDAAGRGPRPGRNGRVDAEDWLAWARRKVSLKGLDWDDATVEPCAPGSWFDATHGVNITVGSTRQFRFEDQVSGRIGPWRRTAKAAARDGARHDAGCRRQGGFGAAIVVDQDDNRVRFDDDDTEDEGAVMAGMAGGCAGYNDFMGYGWYK